MEGYKRNRIKELWWNRPWVYIPEVVRTMKKHPLTKNGKFIIWVRNCFYINWQVCFEKEIDQSIDEIIADVLRETRGDN